jgi:hypothetical protein
MVTMRTLPVVLNDAEAEHDAMRLTPMCHVRMPQQALTGSDSGEENDCQRWEIWLSRKLDEARGLSIGLIFMGQSKWMAQCCCCAHRTHFFH